MKRGDFIDRGLAFAITLAFLTFVRPDEEPERWAVVLIAIMMYEAVLFCIVFCQKISKKKEKARAAAKKSQDIALNLKAREEDGERWAAEVIDWPMYEEEVIGCGGLRRLQYLR